MLCCRFAEDLTQILEVNLMNLSLTLQVLLINLAAEVKFKCWCHMQGLSPLGVLLFFYWFLMNNMLESSLINFQGLRGFISNLLFKCLHLLNHLDKLIFLSLNLGLSLLQYSNTVQGLYLAGLLNELLKVDQLLRYNFLCLHYFLDFARLFSLIRFSKFLFNHSLRQHTRKLFTVVLGLQFWYWLLLCYFLDGGSKTVVYDNFWLFRCHCLLLLLRDSLFNRRNISSW